MTGAKSGEYSRFLNFHGRNPDVLNSIANLSNDEVFTPPEFANRMLDTLEKAWAESNNGENIWSNPELKFLDPFTKSGVFLREIASRLIKGLESEIPDLQDRVDHILTKQVFGIATTHLTSLMARRSLYCSKKANGKHSVTKKFKDESGNIWFERTEHSWTGGRKSAVLRTDTHGNTVEVMQGARCFYCGASESDYGRTDELESHAYAFIHTGDIESRLAELFGDKMKFDVIIGNPPYQLSSGETSDSPIYQKFVEQAMKIEPGYLAMVTPSRWFTGGKGLDEYRKRMIENRHLKSIVDFPDSKDSFPGVEIKGGVSFFLWSRDYEGDCEFSTVTKGIETSKSRRDLRDGLGVVIRDNQASEIIQKVVQKRFDRLSARVSSQTPFGIYTNFTDWRKSPKAGDIRLYKRGLEEAWIDPKHVTTHKEWISPIKVIMSYAYNGGDALPHQVVGKPIVVPGNSACTQTYMVAGIFESSEEAENYAAYLRTRFVRFLIRQRKISQHNRPDTFAFVPDLPMDKQWTDEDLYDKFSISKAEADYIATQVRAIDADSEVDEPDD